MPAQLLSYRTHGAMHLHAVLLAGQVRVVGLVTPCEEPETLELFWHEGVPLGILRDMAHEVELRRRAPAG